MTVHRFPVGSVVRYRGAPEYGGRRDEMIGAIGMIGELVDQEFSMPHYARVAFLGFPDRTKDYYYQENELEPVGAEEVREYLYQCMLDDLAR
jgi:hypothetical protein